MDHHFHCLLAILACLLVRLTSAQTFTTSRITESTTVQSATNALNITFQSSVELPADATITIKNLLGTQTVDTAALPLTGDDRGKFTATGGGSATAGWSQTTGTLTLTLNTAVNQDTEIKIVVHLINSGEPQSNCCIPTIEVDSGTITIASTEFTASPLAGVLSASTSHGYVTVTTTSADSALMLHMYFHPKLSSAYSNDTVFNVTYHAYARLQMSEDGTTPKCHASYNQRECPSVTNSQLQFDVATATNQPTLCTAGGGSSYSGTGGISTGTASNYNANDGGTLCNVSIATAMLGEVEPSTDASDVYNITLQGLTNGYLYDVTLLAMTSQDDGTMVDAFSTRTYNTSYVLLGISTVGQPLMQSSTFLTKSTYYINDTVPTEDLKIGIDLDWTQAIPNGRPITSYIITATPDAAAVLNFSKDFKNDFGNDNYNHSYFEKELNYLIDQDVPNNMVYTKTITETENYVDTSQCNFLELDSYGRVSASHEMYVILFNLTNSTDSSMTMNTLHESSIQSNTLTNSQVSGQGITQGSTVVSVTNDSTSIPSINGIEDGVNYDPQNEIILELDAATAHTGVSKIHFSFYCNGTVLARVISHYKLMVENDVPYSITIQPTSVDYPLPTDASHYVIDPNKHQITSNTLVASTVMSVAHSVRTSNVLSEAGNGNAKIYFAPPYHGNSTLTGYVVESIQWNWIDNLKREDAEFYCTLDNLTTIDASSSQWNLSTVITTVPGENVTHGVVDELENGNCYAFRVRAANVIGIGPPSGWSGIVVPGGPPSVPLVTAIAGDRSATVTWTVPRNNGRALLDYSITLQKIMTTYPEGIDKDEPILSQWDVRPETDTRTIAVVTQSSSIINATESYVWSHATGHPIDNGEMYAFHVVARNIVGSGVSGTHDNGTDVSLVEPLFRVQGYATTQWRFPTTESPNRHDPRRWPPLAVQGRVGSVRTTSLSPPVLSNFEDIVYVCTNVEYSADRDENVATDSFVESNVVIGHVQGWNTTDGSLIFDFESPQYEPFLDNHLCPSVDPFTGLVYFVSNAVNPNNTHAFLLGSSSTQAFQDRIAEVNSTEKIKLQNKGVYDFQNNQVWWHEKPAVAGETDLLYNFYLSHRFQVHKTWTVNMKAIHANGGRSIFWNSTEHTKLVFYTPPLRSSIIIGKTKTIVDRTAYSFPHQPTIANNNNNNSKEIVNFVTSSDGYLYAWIGSSMYNYNDNGTRILSFRSDQCDTKERIVLPSIEEYSRKMNNYNITIDQFARKCGCPGLSIQDNYRYTQTPVLHEYPPNVFTLYVVTVDDGGLEAEIDNPNLDQRRSDLRPTVSMLSAINVTHLLMSDNIYQYVHRPDVCLGQNSPNVTAMDEIDYTHVIWSVYSNSSNENNILSTNNLNSSSGIIHMPPVGKDDLIFVPAYKMLSALNAGDGTVSGSTGTVVWDYLFPTRIVDVYAAPGDPFIAAEDYIYIRTFDRYITALHHHNGSLAWRYQAGPSTFSHPIRSSDHDSGNHPKDGYYVQSTDGTTHALTCPPESHIVLDRLVYVCPALTLVRPTSKDLCSELESPCVAGGGSGSESNIENVRPPTYWPGLPKTEMYPQRWVDGEDGIGVYSYGVGVGVNGGTGL